jgi:hypothetical protein
VNIKNGLRRNTFKATEKALLVILRQSLAPRRENAAFERLHKGFPELQQPQWQVAEERAQLRQLTRRLKRIGKPRHELDIPILQEGGIPISLLHLVHQQNVESCGLPPYTSAGFTRTSRAESVSPQVASHQRTALEPINPVAKTRAILRTAARARTMTTRAWKRTRTVTTEAKERQQRSVSGNCVQSFGGVLSPVTMRTWTRI